MSESEQKSEARERERKNIPPAADGSAPFDKGDTTPAPEDGGTPFVKGDFSAWQLAWELGYTIAIPIVIFALVGRWADKAWGTSPWLLLAGVVISIIISSAMVYQKVKKIL